jgi:hypothetical protein
MLSRDSPQSWRLSRGAAIATLCILLVFIVCSGVIAYLCSTFLSQEDQFGLDAICLSALLSFGATSLFCIRKLYLILFDGERIVEPSWETDAAFMLYLCCRPWFSLLSAIFFMVVMFIFIDSVTTTRTYSIGIILLSIMSGIMISAASGEVLDELLRLGRVFRHKLAGTP